MELIIHTNFKESHQKPIQHTESTMSPIFRKYVKNCILFLFVLSSSSCSSNFFNCSSNCKPIMIYKHSFCPIGANGLFTEYYIFQYNHQYSIVCGNNGSTHGRWTISNDTICIYETSCYIETESDSLLIKEREYNKLYPYTKFHIKGKYLKECTDYTDFLKYDSEEDSIQHYQQDLIDAHYLNEHVKKYNYMTRIRQ